MNKILIIGINGAGKSTIIFFNFNKLLCLYRIFKRTFDKTQPFDKAEGNLNTISWNLIKSVILYQKKKNLDRLEQYKETKKIIIFKNTKEVEKYLATFSQKIKVCFEITPKP
jgi:predicted ABC-type ATPase